MPLLLRRRRALRLREAYGWVTRPYLCYAMLCYAMLRPRVGDPPLPQGQRPSRLRVFSPTREAAGSLEQPGATKDGGGGCSASAEVWASTAAVAASAGSDASPAEGPDDDHHEA